VKCLVGITSCWYNSVSKSSVGGMGTTPSTFPNILSIRCIAHYIQLIASDIVKIDWAKNTLQNIQKIITFFRNNYQAGSALRDDIIESLITGGYLKTTVKTCWSTAWDACESMICLERSIKSVSIINIKSNTLLKN